MKKLYFLFILLFSVLSNIFAQSKTTDTHNCAADNLHLQELKNNPDYKRNFDIQNANYQDWVLKETIKNNKHYDNQLITPTRYHQQGC